MLNFVLAIERFRCGLKPRSIEVDGETWHYLEGGAPDAPVVLLLHGFGGDKDNWTRFSRKMVKDYRVIAPDLPGFGESARHADWDYSLNSQRDRLRAFVAALELGPFHLGGNSMGGQLAVIYAHAFPEQVRSLLLFNNAGIDAPVRSEMWEAADRGEILLVVSSVDDFDRLISFVSHERPFLPWPVKKALAERAFENAGFNRSVFEAIKGERYVPLEPLLGDIQQPVLVIWGEHDRVLDVSSIDVMKPLLPQAKFIVMPDAAHIPMIEKPSLTAGYCREFLACKLSHRGEEKEKSAG